MRMAGQPPPPIATAHPTSSGNHDDHSTGTRPSAIGSVDGDSQRADVLDLLVSAVVALIPMIDQPLCLLTVQYNTTPTSRSRSRSFAVIIT
jgi:hypothetical protein